MKIRLTSLMAIMMFLATIAPTIGVANGASTVLTVADVLWGSPSSPIEVAPGDNSVPLSVTFINTRKITITSITGSINLTGGFSNTISPSNQTESSSFAGTVSPGATFTLRFLLNVAQDLSLGDYTLPITVEFSELDAFAIIIENFVITFPVTGRSLIEAHLQNTTLVAGGDNQVAVVLVNSGSARASLLEVSIAIPPGAPLSFVGQGGNWFIELLVPGESFSLPLNLHANPLAAKSAYSLTATIAYRDTYGMPRLVTRSLGVSVGSPPVEEISIEAALSPTIITAGSTSEVVLSVRNQGGVTARSLDLSLGLPQGVTSPLAVLGSAGHWTFDRLSPGQTANLTLTLYSSPSAGNAAYQLPLSIRYQDAYGNSLLTTRVLGIYVQGLIKMSVFEISYDYVGVSPTISGNLLNEGNVAALFTTISIVAPAESGLTPKESIYIGDLNPNAPQPFSIALSVPHVTNITKYSVRVLVTFKDELRGEHAEEFPITVTVTPPPTERVSPQRAPWEQFIPASWQQFVIPAVVGVMIGILVGLRRRRKSPT